ncbi:glycoside hydrolase family 32 protein [Paludibacterium yongneupense]|uniref:glycoside hydrolase family 32 protein n=1 Tax=Paludibacterium yongneupense TaxID=400061 RepID=UPI0006862D17|nr:sucrose-6-phosphate hydrolase [Paludibacterium yongneupense]
MEKMSAQAASWRQRFHLMPPRGLMNDPNGLVWFDGAYHVFYQWHGDSCRHGLKSWGHYASPDLVNWRSLPPALTPEHDYESHGCYSGSALVDGDDLLLLYTGNVRLGNGERASYQCLARSTDGVRFAKRGPVLSAPPSGFTQHFRDPKVWREGDDYFMVMGAQTVQEQGTVLLYRSDTPSSWHLVGDLLPVRDNGYMCECPDFFRLNGMDMLLFCPQGRQPEGNRFQNRYPSGYVAGRADLATATFEHDAFDELDRGFDFYAPQTMLDPGGRRILFGWMGLPEEEETPTVDDGWSHCLTLPRVLEWREGRLWQQPPVELQALRGPVVAHGRHSLDGELSLPGLVGECFELECEIEPGEASRCGIDVRAGGDAFTRIEFDSANATLRLDRRASGTGASGVRTSPPLGRERLRLRVFVDCSSIEIFVNDGEQVFTARIYPPAGAEAIRFFSAGAAVLNEVRFWSMACARESAAGLEIAA